MDNYRAITLSPVVSKIFEHCLLPQLNDYLVTSELQCGFKPNVGCNEALAMFCNTVQYFTSNGSTVPVAALDMAKAFDKVDHYALLLKLMSRGVPPCFISLLFDWYGKIYICVKWGNCKSKPVQLVTGVRQGGLLSPVLFTVYVDDITCKLEVSGYGCRIARKYVGILMYADDLLLISASNCDLRKMIDICESETAWLDMCFNVNKSCLLRCGPRYKKPCVPIL